MSRSDPFTFSKAEKEFGFKAKTNFEEGLKKTIDWYLSSLPANQLTSLIALELVRLYVLNLNLNLDLGLYSGLAGLFACQLVRL